MVPMGKCERQGIPAYLMTLVLTGSVPVVHSIAELALATLPRTWKKFSLHLMFIHYHGEYLSER